MEPIPIAVYHVLALQVKIFQESGRVAKMKLNQFFFSNERSKSTNGV